jgi:hypothetical protein
MSLCNNTEAMPNNLLHKLSGTWSIYLCRLSYPYIILLVSWVLCQGPRADKKLSRTSSRAQAWCWPWRGPSLCHALHRTPGLFSPDQIQNIKKWKISDSVGVTYILCNFHIHSVHLDIIKVFYSPTDAQVNCLKNNFKTYIRIDINL